MTSEGAEAHAARAEVGNDADEVRKAPSQPVKFPCHKNVAGLQCGERFVQGRSAHGAGDPLVVEDLIASRARQRIHLERKVLFIRRYTRVADLHAFQKLKPDRTPARRAATAYHKGTFMKRAAHLWAGARTRTNTD